MEPINIEDINNIIEREKLFIDSATNFLSTIKLNLPEPSDNLIRTTKEIEACNKVAAERKEGRKIKSTQRNLKKVKKNEDVVDMNEYIGTKEFDKAVGNKQESMQRGTKGDFHDKRMHGKGPSKSRDIDGERNAVNKKYGGRKEAGSRYGDKEFTAKKFTGRKPGGSKYSDNKFSKFNSGANKTKRLGKSRRAEVKNRKTARNN